MLRINQEFQKMSQWAYKKLFWNVFVLYDLVQYQMNKGADVFLP